MNGIFVILGPSKPRQVWLLLLSGLYALLPVSSAHAGIIASNDREHWCHPTLGCSSLVGRAAIAELGARYLESSPNCYWYEHPQFSVVKDGSMWRAFNICTLTPPVGGVLVPGGPSFSRFCRQGERFDTDIADCVCDSGKDYAGEGMFAVCMPVVTVDRTKRRTDTCYGNPIFPLSGSKRESVPTGLSVAGVEWVLTYDSTPAITPAPAAEGAPALGRLWSSTFHRRLTGRVAYRGDGTVVTFPNQDRDITDSLGPSSGDERAYFSAGNQAIEVYGQDDGALRRMVFADGRLLSLSYSTAATPTTVAPAPGYLIRAEDRFGRGLSFEYALPPGSPPASGGLLARALRGGVAVATFAYDAAFNLTDVTWADGRRRSLVYGDTRWPWALTGVIDERRIRVSTFGYDGAGRAESTEHAGGTERFTVSYAAPPRVEVTEVVTDVITRTYSWVAPVDPVVTLPNRSTVRLGVITRFGRPLVTSRSQPAGAGCAAATSATAYDANGNVTSEDDFNGNRTCVGRVNANYVYRVEGLPAGTDCSTVAAYKAMLPPGARRITTEMIGNWTGTSLVKRVSEPNRITNYVYNGQPDPTRGNLVTWCAPQTQLVSTGLFGMSPPTPILVLCRVIELATTDDTGTQYSLAPIDPAVVPRITSYTYNEAGQVLTEDGPRTDVSDVTTYSYYTDTTTDHVRGDLYQVTTPTGQTTSYLGYGAAGEVRLARDANGLDTSFGYDARGRLSKANGLIAYAYDEVGRLSMVTPPSLNSTRLTYDAAGRFVGFSRSNASSVSFVLDAAGHVIRRDVRNKAGELVRTGTRVIDALGRTQTATGEVLR